MIKMAKAQYIKHLYENEGKSKNEIRRITGLNYRTVCRYVEKTDWNAKKEPNMKAEHYPILGEYLPLINEWLEGDMRVPRKQRHTAKRIYDRLCREAGYQGSYSSVKRYVKKKRMQLHQAGSGYVPLAHPEAYGQADFGEFLYYDAAGNEKKGYAFTISFPYSNKGYTQAFPSQNQECLLEGMKRIFEHIGGVPVRIRFDNMSTAVAQVLEGSERKLTDGFTRFMLHYRFQADFCNPASGNEKGNVENKVGYSRRNAFVPVPTITSFEDFNEKLWDWCEEDAQRPHYKHQVSIQSLWEEEAQKLLTLPEVPYDVFRYESLRVNKCGFVSVDTNQYGLSPELNGETVQAKIFYDRIEFWHDQMLAGKYHRSYGRNEKLTDWTKYVHTLYRKPGAAEHTEFFRQIPELWQDYLMQTKGAERKNALKLLRDMVEDDNAENCTEILLLAQQNGTSDVESLRQCYYSLLKEERTPEPLKLLSDVPTLNYRPDLKAYDMLTGGGETE